MKSKFNEYCAEVMGININNFTGKAVQTLIGKYNPYDDLNQMAEVVEKLVCANRGAYSAKRDGDENQMLNRIKGRVPVKQAFRDFIISTISDN